MPDLTDLDDDRYYDSLHDDAEEEWFRARIADNIEEVFDEHFEAIFRSNVAEWSAKRWPQAEATAYRVGREARAFAGRRVISAAGEAGIFSSGDPGDNGKTQSRSRAFRMTWSPRR